MAFGLWVVGGALAPIVPKHILLWPMNGDIVGNPLQRGDESPRRSCGKGEGVAANGRDKN